MHSLLQLWGRNIAKFVLDNMANIVADTDGSSWSYIRKRYLIVTISKVTSCASDHFRLLPHVQKHKSVLHHKSTPSVKYKHIKSKLILQITLKSDTKLLCTPSLQHNESLKRVRNSWQMGVASLQIKMKGEWSVWMRGGEGVRVLNFNSDIIPNESAWVG